MSKYKHRDDLPFLMDVQDVANVLNISKPNAYKLLQKEDIPQIRHGNSIRVPKEGFLSWLQDKSGYQAEESVIHPKDDKVYSGSTGDDSVQWGLNPNRRKK